MGVNPPFPTLRMAEGNALTLPPRNRIRISAMKILPPSKKLMQRKRAYFEKPRKPQTAEQARKQVEEHLREAREEMSRIGRAEPVH